jgi:hypothetical protein
VITVNQSYTEIGFPEVLPLRPIKFKHPLDGLAHLMQVHMLFGGRIYIEGPGQIKAVSCILGKTDTAVYSGPPEEMKMLAEMVIAYDKSRVFVDEVVTASIEAHSKIAQKGGFAASTMALSLMANHLLGSAKFKVTVMIYMGVTDKADIDVGLTMSIDELVAVLQLVEEGHGSFRTVLAATAA